MERIIRKIVPGSTLKQIRLLLKLPVLIKHKGNVYQCPICGYKSKDWYLIGDSASVNQEWEIIGAGLRRAGCRKCNSSDKERLLFLFLQRTIKERNPNGYTILHFAPERGIYEFLSKLSNVEYITADLYPDGFRYFDKNIRKMDILTIPLADNSVDLIICNHVLEHIPDDNKAMKELYRVLKPDGYAILQVPISPILETTIEDLSIIGEKEREKAFGQSDHVRIYGQDYFTRLESVGFNVTKVNNFENKDYFGLNPREYICLAIKK